MASSKIPTPPINRDANAHPSRLELKTSTVPVKWEASHPEPVSTGLEGWLDECWGAWALGWVDSGRCAYPSRGVLEGVDTSASICVWLDLDLVLVRWAGWLVAYEGADWGLRKRVWGRSLLLIDLGLGCGLGGWAWDEMEMEMCLYSLCFRCINVGFHVFAEHIRATILAMNDYSMIE